MKQRSPAPVVSRALCVFSAAILCWLPSAVLLSSQPRPLRFEELLALSLSGLGEDRIRDQIAAAGLDFCPTPQALEVLRRAGLGEDALKVVLAEKGPPAEAVRPRPTIRIFEQLLPDGRRALVLTNLDENGEPIRDPDGERVASRRSPPAAPDIPRESAREEPGPRPSPPPEPAVIVNVNVSSPAVPFFPLWVASTGAAVGPFRYPDRLNFLGYGAGISSPGWFSGLGLNPSNNFGHRAQDKPNQEGLGALLGPSAR